MEDEAKGESSKTVHRAFSKPTKQFSLLSFQRNRNQRPPVENSTIYVGTEFATLLATFAGPDRGLSDAVLC